MAVVVMIILLVMLVMVVMVIMDGWFLRNKIEFAGQTLSPPFSLLLLNTIDCAMQCFAIAYMFKDNSGQILKLWSFEQKV